MITLEKMSFLKEEVILTKLNTTEGSSASNPFNTKALKQDNSDYVLYRIVKVGDKQVNVYLGQEVLVSEQIPQKIVIRNQGEMEGYFKLINSDPIFAVIGNA